MASVIYKAGNQFTIRGIKCNKEVVSPELLSGMLKNGWKLSPEACYEDKDIKEINEIVNEVVEEKEEKTETVVNVGQLNLEILSDDDIRAAASKAGIKSWHVKKIDNLKKELKGYAP